MTALRSGFRRRSKRAQLSSTSSRPARRQITSAASTNAQPRYFASSSAQRYSPRLAAYSAPRTGTSAAARRSSPAMSTPSCAAMAAKRSSAVSSAPASPPAARSKRSVIFSSPAKRFPGAETTAKRRAASARNISAQARTRPASASELPPNLHTIMRIPPTDGAQPPTAWYGAARRSVSRAKQTVFCFIFVNSEKCEGFFARAWYILFV